MVGLFCHGMASQRRRPAPHQNENFTPNWHESIDNFDLMGLRDDLLHGVFAYGFRDPSPIQALSVRPIIDHRQVIAQARSGTGKTGAFGIGILNNLDLSSQTTQAFIISPTRELATQTFEFLKAIGAHMHDLSLALFIGGHSIREDQEKASKNPHVAVCAPGRALDLITNGYLRCENVHMLCLDEADQLLKDDFLEQIKQIFVYLHEGCQMLLFSATIPLEAFNIMDQFMQNPVRILVSAEQLTLDGISQFYVNVGEPVNKMHTLIDIFGMLPIQKSVIFANKKDVVEYLKDRLTESGFTVSAIHANLTQSERDVIMKDFRLGRSRVLIGTDLIARGIDVQQVTIVFNFEVPRDPESYLHRIGRSGRHGRKGVAINICEQNECRTIDHFTRYYQCQIAELPHDIDRIVREVNEDHERRDSSSKPTADPVTH
jgi:translation initiation factor 4A